MNVSMIDIACAIKITSRASIKNGGKKETLSVLGDSLYSFMNVRSRPDRGIIGNEDRMQI